MNKRAKIIILIAAVLLSVGGIMYYYKTVVTPPQNRTLTNQHLADLEKEINLISENNGDRKSDMLYYSFLDELYLFASEGILNDDKGEVGDKLIEKYINKYTPVFTMSCYAKFNASDWNSDDHRWMLQRISELRGFKFASKQGKVLDEDYKNNLTEIEGVVSDYSKAVSIASNTAYTGLENAKSSVAAAKRFANMVYLKNCHKLVNALNEVPRKLNSGHFYYLQNLVKSLSSYKQYSGDDFEKLSDFVYAQLNDYSANAKEIYGAKLEGVEDLQSLAGKYYSEANNYYNQ